MPTRAIVPTLVQALLSNRPASGTGLRRLELFRRLRLGGGPLAQDGGFRAAVRSRRHDAAPARLRIMAPICCDPVFAAGTGAHASTALQGLAASSFIKAAPPASPISDRAASITAAAIGLRHLRAPSIRSSFRPPAITTDSAPRCERACVTRPAVPWST
jgi:hypothetical protein